MKSFLAFIWEIVKIVIIALIIVVPIRYFVFQPFFVRGQSMEPNFADGNYLIVDEISYRLGSPQRGEVVVFKYPGNLSQRYIKRIIGLPGEMVEVEDNKVIIFNENGTQILNETSYLSPFTSTPGDVKVTLAEDEYFVLGDNRVSSSDSRSWGPLPREDIIGRVIFRAWPFGALAKFGIPAYE